MSRETPSVKHPPGAAELSQDGRKLRRRRIAAGLSVTELAARCECSKAHLSMLENSKHGASAEFLARVAAELGCQIADLMADEGNTVNVA